MDFNIFRFKLILFQVLLVFSSISSFYFLFYSEFWLLSVWCILLSILFIVLIIRESERGRRELTNFINSIKFGEFKNTYASKNTNDHLAQAYDNLIQVYRELSTEKERNHLYLKTIVEHVDTALLCFDEEDNIVILNEAAKRFFGRNFILNINVITGFDKGLSQHIVDIKSGQKILYKFIRSGSPYHVSLHATEFKLKEELFKLVSVQDVRYELEEQEIESWRKLVRVLTHEIMNTAIPISTLAGVTNQLLKDDSGDDIDLKELSFEDQNDLKHSLNTIEKRSKGMVEFVQATKNYTNIPEANFVETDIFEVIQNVFHLLKADLEKQNISVLIDKDKKIPKTKLDVKLIEQVLINIIKNAKDALSGIADAKINISLRYSSVDGNLHLRIKDNGKGIQPDILQNIFVPFFTTKKDGSGIGLSLSRQIMRIHKGDIYISSEPDKGTKVNLRF